MGGINPPFPLEGDSSKEGNDEIEEVQCERTYDHTMMSSITISENDIEQKVDESALAKNYASIERLLKIMCCYFADKRGPIFMLSILVNGLVWSASFYQLVYAFVYALKANTITTSTWVIAVMTVWAIQSLISHVFLIRWQLTGQLRSIIRQLTIAHDPSVHNVPDKAMRQTVVFFYFSISFCAVVNIASVLINIFGLRAEVFNRSERQVYYFEGLHSFRFILSFYTFITYGLSVTTFALFTRATTVHFHYFNRLLAQVGTRRSTERAELLMAMKTHMKLLLAVRELNKAFEVYAFLMLGNAIPITIFSVFMFSFTMTKSWTNIVVTVPSLIICVAQILVFTLIPANLNESLANLKQTILLNEKLWVPFREDIYHVVSAFLVRAIQTDIGITIWGFAVVTKPMILSTISMVVTCIAFLVEQRRDSANQVTT